ncbi:MAG TPA: hypothetical protein VFF28_00310 [Candidatus Nanoarchaeia archaeon]|nr:hypothetical protein [Candidatus Nanoarchaeia archaeon]
MVRKGSKPVISGFADGTGGPNPQYTAPVASIGEDLTAQGEGGAPPDANPMQEVAEQPPASPSSIDAVVGAGSGEKPDQLEVALATAPQKYLLILQATSESGPKREMEIAPDMAVGSPPATLYQMHLYAMGEQVTVGDRLYTPELNREQTRFASYLRLEQQTGDGKKREWEFILCRPGQQNRSVHGDYVTFHTDSVTLPDGTLQLHAIKVGGRVLGKYR